MSATLQEKARPTAAPILELEPMAAHLPAVSSSMPTAPGAAAPSDPYRMLEMAVERGMPLEVIQQFMTLAERLEQMRERDRQRKAENAYIAALAALKSKVVTVLKTRHVKYPTKDRDGCTNGSVDFKHAELADIMEAVAPAAAEVGLSWNYPEIEQSKDWVRVTCRLQHIDGYSERVTLGGAPDDSGRKNALQQIASAITYLQRYTLKALLGISEKGDDTDGLGRGSKGAVDEDGGATTTGPAPIEHQGMKDAKTMQELVKVMNTLKQDEKKKYLDYFNVRSAKLKETCK